jgi:threonine dehydrogenase-like Zn-dependent dehydrogenase
MDQRTTGWKRYLFQPMPGQALVRVEAVGICASDLKCYHGAAKFWGDDSRAAWAETMVIPGHEFVGEVVQLDDRASGRWQIEVGDRVVSEQIVPCWECRYCKRGQYWMCAPHDIYGFKRRTPGAMASYMIYPAEALVHKVSKELPAAHAAFAEPLSCALQRSTEHPPVDDEQRGTVEETPTQTHEGARNAPPRP